VVAKRAVQLKSRFLQLTNPAFAGFVFNACKMLTSLQNNESVEVN
jgi:hypothetical protein